eukprot:jgi/Astpho2/9601/fgenesh1_pg.00146_%23_40_t
MAGSAAAEGVVQAQTIANLAAQHVQLQQQLAEVQQTTAVLKVAAQLEQRLADFDAYMAAGMLHSRNVCMAAMRLLVAPPGYCKQQSSVLAGRGSFLKAAECAAELQQAAQADEWGQTGAVQQAQAERSRLLDELQRLADLLLVQFLEPLLNMGLASVGCSAGELQGALGTGIALQWWQAGAHQDDASSVAEIVAVFLGIVAEHVFSSDRRLIGQLGSQLWPQLATQYTQHCLLPMQPGVDHSPGSKAQFQQAAAASLALEGEAARLGFLVQADKEAGDLGRRISEYIDHQNNRILIAQRLQASLDRLLAGRYKVTKAALALVGLIRSSLQEACEAGTPAAVQSGCNAVLDMASLLIAVPQGVYGEQLQIPQLALLYHNNCQHVAHEVLLLPYAFSPHLDNVGGHPVDFLDAARRLRQAGRESLDAQVPRQLQEVSQLLASAQGFRNVAGDAEAAAAGRALDRALHTIRRCGALLRSTLPVQEQARLAADLLQGVSQELLDQLMSLRDISAVASEQLPVIFGPFLEQAPDAVSGRRAQSRPGSASTLTSQSSEQLSELGQMVLEHVRAQATAFHKLQEVVEIMNLRLLAIKEKWQSGRLGQLGLTATEVKGLVYALFERSSTRDELVQDCRRKRSRNLSRQTFGKLQAKLFPQYFALLSGSATLALGTAAFGSHGTVTTRQLIPLLLALLTSVVNWVWVEPVNTRLMFRRYDLENSDTHKDKDAIDKLRKKFGAWHGLSSMLNLGALCAALAHAWWLAGRTGLAAAI